MQVFIALLWVFLVLTALILPVIMLIWLWGRIRLTLNQLGNTVDKFQYTFGKAEGKYQLPFKLRKSGVSARPQDIAAAKKIRYQIKENRYNAKQSRLAQAKSRWEKLGLI